VIVIVAVPVAEVEAGAVVEVVTRVTRVVVTSALEMAGRRVLPADGMTVGSASSSQIGVVKTYSAILRPFVMVTCFRKVTRLSLR